MDLSPSSLIASLVVSSIGMYLFMYGKKQLRVPQLLAGLALMIGPYFTGAPGETLGLGGVLLGGLVVALRAGA